MDWIITYICKYTQLIAKMPTKV